MTPIPPPSLARAITAAALARVSGGTVPHGNAVSACINRLQYRRHHRHDHQYRHHHHHHHRRLVCAGNTALHRSPWGTDPHIMLQMASSSSSSLLLLLLSAPSIQPSSRQFTTTTTAAAASDISDDTSSPSPSPAVVAARDRRYKTVDEADVRFFRSVLPDRSCVLCADEGDDLSGYNTDWLGAVRGESRVVLRPRTTEQVSRIASYCSEKGIALVPQGGNTGLVGGGVPVFDEVVLNMGLMNRIEQFDQRSGVLVCGAGCILEQLSQFLAQRGYIMPIDLGAKGTCQIGGNLATNAGGLRYLRYRSLHANVLGVEVVLADGRVLDNVKTVSKDNTGYHLNQLFIGSEGTLGIITKVSIQAPIKPSAVNVVLLGLRDFESVQRTFHMTKQKLGEILSAFEFFDGQSMRAMLEHMEKKNPLEGDLHPFYVLLETHGSNGDHDAEKLNTFFEAVLDSGLAVDGTLGLDDTKSNELWTMREEIPECIRREGYVYKFDISIPLSKMYEIVEQMRTEFRDRPGVEVFGYGHLGDSNLHLNITLPERDDTFAAEVGEMVYKWTSENNGSISAEHGIGLLKPQFLHFSKSPVAIDLMRGIKKAFDPRNILNPYKLLQ